MTGTSACCLPSISLAILTTLENCTLFSAADCRSSIEKIFSPLSLINFAANSIFVPCNLATIGVRRFMLSTTLIKPCAMASHLTIPPKILTKMAVTLGSLVMRSKACLIACGVAPPPTSRKLAGEPPFSLMISIVAIARPAPLTGPCQ